MGPKQKCVYLLSLTCTHFRIWNFFPKDKTNIFKSASCFQHLPLVGCPHHVAREVWSWLGSSWCCPGHDWGLAKRHGGVDAASEAFQAGYSHIISMYFSVYGFFSVSGNELKTKIIQLIILFQSLLFPEEPVVNTNEVTLVILNYSAPSLLREDVQSVSKRMVAQLMDQNGDETAAILICPTFTYKMGTLFSDEYSLTKGFNDLGVHVDLQCQLVYDPKTKPESQINTGYGM